MTAQESLANGEPQLIEVELDPPAVEDGDNRKLFRVECTRTVEDYFYIYSVSKDAAEDAAAELRDECLSEALDRGDSHFLSDAKYMTDDTSVWIEGDDPQHGYWGSMSELPPELHQPAKAVS